MTSSLQGLYARRYLFALSALLTVALVWLFGHPLAMGPAAALAVWGARGVHQRLLRGLERRMNDVGGPVWEVRLNQVTVGTIADRDYAALRHEAFTDLRLYGAQFLNTLRVALRALDYCYMAIPIAAFWLVAALAVFAPDVIGSAVEAAHKASPQDVQGALRLAIPVLLMGLFIAFGSQLLLGLTRFGFVNRFSEAVSTSVRLHCNAAAEGDMLLVRRSRDGLHINHELDQVRQGARR